MQGGRNDARHRALLQRHPSPGGGGGEHREGGRLRGDGDQPQPNQVYGGQGEVMSSRLFHFSQAFVSVFFITHQPQQNQVFGGQGEVMSKRSFHFSQAFIGVFFITIIAHCS